MVTTLFSFKKIVKYTRMYIHLCNLTSLGIPWHCDFRVSITHVCLSQEVQDIREEGNGFRATQKPNGVQPWAFFHTDCVTAVKANRS